MWLTSSSIGRKLIMALTGAFLVLFVTFHVLMNGVALFWPTAYNVVCEFLGANWYALIGSAILALGFILHILYALWLTWQNRSARGGDRYKVTTRPHQVEWSSKNMLVLGIVILCFLAVHMWQFWAKMQLVEVLGIEGEFPPAAGTLFIQQAFSCPWTLVIYLIGFIALWFHLCHGIWSMCQSTGINNKTWMPRLRCIGNIWATLVVLLFIVEAVVFTVCAKKNVYLDCPALQAQYQEMMATEASESCPFQSLEAAEGGCMLDACEATPCDKPCDMDCADCGACDAACADAACAGCPNEGQCGDCAPCGQTAACEHGGNCEFHNGAAHECGHNHACPNQNPVSESLQNKI